MLKKIIALSLPLALFGEKPISRFGFDRKMSPSVAGDNLITLSRGISYAQDMTLGPAPGFWTRSFEMLALYFPLSNWSSTVQHEVFGHGWRIRSLGKEVAQVSSYKIWAPFPYSKFIAAGLTFYSINRKITTDQSLSIAIAGLEAEAILAKKLKKRWIASGEIEKRLTFLYNSASLSLTNYALSIRDINEDGHDVSDFANNLNLIYPNSPISRSHIKWRSLFNYLDPMVWISVVGTVNYLVAGENLSIPMIRTKGVRWLPNYRVDLSPFGLDNTFETYMLIDSKLLYTYGRFAKRGGAYAFGCGFDRHGLFKVRKTSFDVELDLWRQPEMATSLGESRSGKNIWGVRALFTMNVDFGRLIWYEQFGFKTKGYFQGESLEKALIGRLGIAARF